MNTLPNLLIVGTQKSGTTWTHFTLKKSKYIFGSKVKELNFFNKVDYNLEENINKYKENFIKDQEIYYMESTPHYFRLPNSKYDSAMNIKSLLGSTDFKLIVIFRNPIERALSATVHHMMKERLEYKKVITEINNAHSIIDLGMYYEILKYWKSIFGDNLGVFFYDEIENNPQGYIKSIFDFLNVEDTLSDEELNYRVNDKKIKVTKMEENFLPKCTMKVIEELYHIYREDMEKLFEYTEKRYDSWYDLENIYKKFNK